MGIKEEIDASSDIACAVIPSSITPSYKPSLIPIPNPFGIDARDMKAHLDAHFQKLYNRVGR